jgi:putative DNA primase/helicase
VAIKLVTDNHGSAGIYKDFVRDIKGHISEIDSRFEFKSIEVKKKPKKSQMPEIMAILRNSVPLEGTPGEMYFIKRGIALPKYPANLLYNPNVIHGPSKQMLPAIVARIVDSEGHVQGLHRIFIDGRGNKADVTPNKMAKGKIKGNCVPLFRQKSVMGIAEGIETALACAMIYKMPVWAAVCGSNMKDMWIPEGVERFHVFGDIDKHGAGQKYAEAAASKHGVTVNYPNYEGDFNDILLKSILE